MSRRSQRTKKEKDHFTPSKTNHQQRHITRICTESDTNSDTTVNLNVNVCINNKDSIKYTTYHIKYSCAFCIIRKENIFERATNITKTVHNQLNNTDKVYPTPQTTVNDTNQSSQQSINITCKPKQKSFKEVTEDILIVDNIKEPEKCKTSTDIRKEISKKEKGSNIIQFSYKLPLGGIALHFPSSEEKKKFKERDAKEVFGEDSVAHNPASHFHKQNIIGFAKNIPLKFKLG
ncbi:unnamed protein product [Mytilus edulis]|uniref:Uncharacterized protein n=1 Tax=Mytilus edulis TaxID=6550 RepID=A0A8S3R921_MYTED|nr:unnamed protein product [Mytilus edulis]